MEWTDTLMLEVNRQRSAAEDEVSSERAGRETVQAVSARVVAVQGISLLHAGQGTQNESIAVLELLRGFRTTGRRVVMCDNSCLAIGRQFGRDLVQHGAAEMVVSCGLQGRDLAIGARDAGLDLASVVVCLDALVGCEVLIHRLAQGDTVLLWGIEQETCNHLVVQLDKRLSERTLAAA